MTFYSSAGIYYPKKGTINAPRTWLDMTSTFTWAHSGEAVTYTRWANNFPDPSKPCTVMVPTGAWRSLACTARHAFICELEER